LQNPKTYCNEKYPNVRATPLIVRPRRDRSKKHGNISIENSHSGTKRNNSGDNINSSEENDDFSGPTSFTTKKIRSKRKPREYLKTLE